MTKYGVAVAVNSRGVLCEFLGGFGYYQETRSRASMYAMGSLNG